MAHLPLDQELAAVGRITAVRIIRPGEAEHSAKEVPPAGPGTTRR